MENNNTNYEDRRGSGESMCFLKFIPHEEDVGCYEKAYTGILKDKGMVID